LTELDGCDRRELAEKIKTDIIELMRESAAQWASRIADGRTAQGLDERDVRELAQDMIGNAAETIWETAPQDLDPGNRVRKET